MTRQPTAPRYPNRLLDIDEVADSLGVSHRYVRRLVAERRIPFVKSASSFGSTRPSSACGSTGSESSPSEAGAASTRPGDNLMGTSGGLEPVCWAPSAFASQSETRSLESSFV